MDAVDTLAIITTALLGSVGHCIGMCGGFIISYSSVKIDDKLSKIDQAFSHSLYNFGRVTTYAFIGALFGLFGQLWEITPYTRAIFFFIIAFFMIFLALSMLGLISSFPYLEYNVTKKSWFKKLFGKLLNSKNRLSFYGLGILNGFFPCSQVYFFAAASAATGSMLWGAFVMIIFGLSTIPALWSFGFFVGLFNQGSFRSIMLKISAIVVALYGLWIGYKAYEILDAHENPTSLVSPECH